MPAVAEDILEDLNGAVLSGRYRVLGRLAEGGLGIVYEAEHVHVGRRYAIKVLKPQYRSSATCIARFRQEAKVGGRLDSGATAAVLDFDVHRGLPYLVMELLEGATLQALLSKHRVLDEARAVHLLLDACDGVASAHRLGVLHRDLKPSNLFVCRVRDREQCKVLDFGVAKLDEADAVTTCAPSTATGALVGTLAYMPREQVRGDTLDERADVYALGAILYQCLTGKRLFDGGPAHALMYRILEERPVPLSQLRTDLDPRLVRCVERAIEPDVALRSTLSEFRTELSRLQASLESNEAVAHRETPAPSSTTHVPTAVPSRRRLVGWAALLACASAMTGFWGGRARGALERCAQVDTATAKLHENALRIVARARVPVAIAAAPPSSDLEPEGPRSPAPRNTNQTTMAGTERTRRSPKRTQAGKGSKLPPSISRPSSPPTRTGSSLDFDRHNPYQSTNP